MPEPNHYGNEHITSANLKPNSRVYKWIPTMSSEICVFMGLLILQDIVHKPTLPSYWSCKPIIEKTFFRNVMTVERFTLILKFVHFVRSYLRDDLIKWSVCPSVRLLQFRFFLSPLHNMWPTNLKLCRMILDIGVAQSLILRFLPRVAVGGGAF